MSSLFEGRIINILANVLSGAIIVVIAFCAWYLKERVASARVRRGVLKERAARLDMLRAELDTIVSFTEKCTVAANALEQFAVYQRWLTANGLLSWKQNRLAVQTWQQTSGTAKGIRLGQTAVAADVIEELAADMRKTDFPAPGDDNFRWHPPEVPLEEERRQSE